MWYGSAAVCVNENNQLLMVRQGKPEELIAWALPAGGVEIGETHEECCIREVQEETGYTISVKKQLFTKRGRTFGIDVTVVYFEVQLVGGTATIQDPDHLIHEISWKSVDEIAELELSFPEDRDFLIGYLNAKTASSSEAAE